MVWQLAARWAGCLAEILVVWTVENWVGHSGTLWVGYWVVLWAAQMERNWADVKVDCSESSTVARSVDLLDLHWAVLRVDTTASKWAATKAGWLAFAKDALMAKLWENPRAVHLADYWADSTAQSRVRRSVVG
jgi:hypothetical protein